MIYLLLAAGLFMGWSLGTNDAAHAFGTAVATRVVKYRTAITITYADDGGGKTITYPIP